MSDDAPDETMAALESLRRGAPEAMDRLIPRVYDELRRIAHRQLGSERSGHTLSTTAVVHEAYLRLADQREPIWDDRAHFFAVAARVMRRVLIDYARRHRAERRGGVGHALVPIENLELADAAALAVVERADTLLAVDEALERLAVIDERMARVVECRYFVGLTEDETATALGVSQRTVARDWLTAKGWLYQELHDVRH